MQPVFLLRSVSYSQFSVIALPEFDQAPAANLPLPSFNRSVASIVWQNSLYTFAVQAGTRNVLTKWFSLNDQNVYAWTNMGGNLIGDPIPVVYESGYLTVFGRGSDNALWYKSCNRMPFYCSNLPWTKIGGTWTSSFAVVNIGPSSVAIFGTAYDGVIRCIFLNDNVFNGTIESMSGLSPTSQPAAVSWGSGRLDIFARGTDNAIWWYFWDGTTWSQEWYSLGGKFVSAPTVASKDVGRLTVFGVNEKGALLTKYFENGAWSYQWNDLGGNLSTTVSVQTTTTDAGLKRYDIFAVDTEGFLSQKTWTGSAWLSWVKHPGISLGSAPASTSQGRLDLLWVFGLDLQQAMVRYSWSKSDSITSYPEGIDLGGQFINF